MAQATSTKRTVAKSRPKAVKKDTKATQKGKKRSGGHKPLTASSSNKKRPAKNSAAATPAASAVGIGKTASSPSPSQSASRSPNPAAGSSKQDKVLTMLHRPGGTTITAIMQATDWQQHSVRGFFAGTVRKKLRLNLTSEKVDGQRVYRIAKAVPSK